MENIIISKQQRKKVKVSEIKAAIAVILDLFFLYKLISDPGVLTVSLVIILTLVASYFIYERFLNVQRAINYNKKIVMRRRTTNAIKYNRI